ncbi:Protein N-acetyltransferase, RimJ/RimL family [Pseudomonas sp. UC 17F4]|nr:Protein N-acetyltransferase, RimJ/RimL family [Pseudomonas sp. UC 17F4]
MELHSERLNMRQIIEDDWPLFLALHGDQRVTRYVCDTQTQSEVRERFESRLPLWLPGSTHWLCLVMFDPHIQEAIGVTGLKLAEPTGSTAEVGYLLLPQFQGKGYGSESLQAVISYARDVLCLDALKGVVTDGNIGSCRVLEKCGFVLEERHADAFCIGEQLFDDLVYLNRIGRCLEGR